MLAAGAVLAAAGLAAVQARQLARPLERVAATAARFGDGDFSSSKLPATQIPEIDRITNALRVSGARVDRMLSTERHFTADATHQLRSGLTGISMRFEILARYPNPEVVDEALAGLSQTEQLNATIDELLAATRDSTTRERTTFDLITVVDDHVAEWSPRFAEARRSLAVISMETSRVVGTKGLAGQVIDILIDNALRHGRGSVTLLVEDTSVTVIDQGPGLSDEQVKSVFEGPNDPSARARARPAARPTPGAGRRRQRRHRRRAATARPLPARPRLTPSARGSSGFKHGRKNPGRKTSRRLQEAGTLEAASGRKHQQSAHACVRAVCGRGQVSAKSEGDTVTVSPVASTTIDPPSWTLPSRIRTAARSPISRWITRFKGRAPNAGS